MERGVIYCYTFENGKTYIGQTINEQQRKRTHIREAKNNSKMYFHRALRKYNFKYTYEVLKEIFSNTKEELIHKLNKYETFYIKQLHSMYDQNGYNVQLGGDNKMSETLVSKLKQRAGVKKYIDNARSAGMKNAKVVVALNKYGEVIAEFESTRETERYYGIKFGGISKHIQLLYSWNKNTGCYFRFKGKDYNNRIRPFLYKYDINKKLIEVYVRIQDAVSDKSTNTYDIYKSLKNKIPIKGFYWEQH